MSTLSQVVMLLDLLFVTLRGLQAITAFARSRVTVQKRLTDLTQNTIVYNVLHNYYNNDSQKFFAPDGSDDLHFKHTRFMSLSPQDGVMQYQFGGTTAEVVMVRDLKKDDLGGAAIKDYTYTLYNSYYGISMELVVQVFRHSVPTTITVLTTTITPPATKATTTKMTTSTSTATTTTSTATTSTSTASKLTTVVSSEDKTKAQKPTGRPVEPVTTTPTNFDLDNNDFDVDRKSHRVRLLTIAILGSFGVSAVCLAFLCHLEGRRLKERHVKIQQAQAEVRAMQAESQPIVSEPVVHGLTLFLTETESNVDGGSTVYSPSSIDSSSEDGASNIGSDSDSDEEQGGSH